MHKFPASTVGQYLPGVGRTITRANIRATNSERAEKQKDPLTAAEIVGEFCEKGTARQRHKHRAELLANKS